MEQYSQAAENNKRPILEVLRGLLSGKSRVLEIGSGSGQHAIYFGCELPHVVWQPTEREACLPALRANVAHFANANVLTPVELDLTLSSWPVDEVDCVYAANVLHIVPVALGEALIAGAGRVLGEGGQLILYGPFKYGGEFTTQSNADFDRWLKSRDPASAIRDFEWVESLAAEQGLTLMLDQAMPANNRLLVFAR